MAVAVYATDLQTYFGATSITGVAEPTGMQSLDGTGVVDSDLAIYGTVCISESMRKAGLGALVYTGTQPTWTAGSTCYFGWFKWFAPNSLGTKVSEGGIRMLVGSTSANYRGWYVDGSDTYTYGGWKNYVVDPTQTGLATQTQGSPTTTYNTVGIGVNAPVSSPSKGNSYTLDIIRYGRGEIRFTNGDLANGYATFNGMSLLNDNPTTGQWGLFQNTGGSYLWKGLMSLGLTGTAVDMRDSNVVINIDNTEMVATNFNRIEVNNASSNVQWDSVLISALGTRSKGEFQMIANATVSKVGCTFTDMSTFVYQSNGTITDTTFRRCGLITQGGSTFSGCLITNSTSTASILSNNPALISDTEFRSDGSNHGLEINTAGTYSFVGNTFVNYAGANGSTGNECIYNNSGGLVTINVTGGDTPTYRNGAGATTVINNNVAITFTGLKDNTEVRIYATTTITELAGIETATVGTTDNRSFTFSLSAGTVIDYRIHNLNYVIIEIYGYTLPSSSTSLPFQQRTDRWYNA